jgi:hypothetical protein
MGETISQIERELAAERDDLGRNLSELEIKARQLTDWRHHYRNHPAALLGAAMATGVVLGIVAGGSRRGSSPAESHGLTADPQAPRPRNRALSRIEQDWHHISDALMGVASAKVMEFVGNLVPGFHDELHRQRGSHV